MLEKSIFFKKLLIILSIYLFGESVISRKMKKFIVFEGLDGSGKTTQVKLLGNSLKKKKRIFC